jgi:NADPH:quinone reductase and related Zn-dependent oxidoreductases
LRQRGLHEAIDYRRKDWTLELNRLTKGKGVALITDPLGGNHWKKSYQGPAFDGTARHVWYFGGNDVEAVWSVASVAACARHAALSTRFADEQKQIRLRVNLGHMWHEADMIAGWMQILLGRRGWLGSPPRGQDLPASGSRHGADLY